MNFKNFKKFLPFRFKKIYLKHLDKKNKIKVFICKEKKCIRKCQKLRWEIFVNELKMFNGEKGKIEKDEFDKFSIHFLAKKNKEEIGVSRLILNSKIGFRGEKIFGDVFVSKNQNKDRFAEISRFGILKEHRGSYLISIKMFSKIIYVAKKRGVDYFIMAIDKRLLIAFENMKFDCYNIVGEEKRSAGVTVIPLVIKKKDLEKHLEKIF